MYWNDLNSRLKAEYGCKVYKLALSSGCSCPNRDGMLDTRGCIFCDGAGAFAEAGAIPDQLAAARLRVAAKAGTDAKYIAYFQSFTNTYGDADRLRALYQGASAKNFSRSSGPSGRRRTFHRHQAGLSGAGYSGPIGESESRQAGVGGVGLADDPPGKRPVSPPGL